LDEHRENISYSMQVLENICYTKNPKDSAAQSLDLYQPEIEHKQATQKYPLLVYIHGGNWVSRDKADYKNIGTHFASLKDNPLCVAVINYRLSKTNKIKHCHQKHTDDCIASLKYLIKSANDKNHHYDSNNIFLVGHSVGGWMITEILLTNNKFNKYKSHIKGCIGVQGIYELPSCYLFLKRVHEKEKWHENYYYTFGEYNEESWRKQSPVEFTAITDHEKNSVRFIFVHSLGDVAVEAKQAEAIDKHLKENLKVKNCELITSEKRIKGGHFDVVDNIGSKSAPDYLSEIILECIHKKN